MEHRTLHGTGLEVSRICFGTMTFGAQTAEPEAKRMVDFCIDQGINFFDTANQYVEGRSEEILGRCLGSRRQQVILASKAGNRTGVPPDEGGLSPAAIRKSIDASLRRLGTDYLDLFYMHLPDRGTPIEDTLETMDELVRAGKARHIAHSNYSAWEAVEMLWLCEKTRWMAPLVTQPMYNLLARGIEQEYLPMCERFGIATVVYNPLAGGMLTGKQNREGPLPGTRFDQGSKLGTMYQNRYWHQQQFDAIDQLKRIAQQAGRSLISLSLNWLLHHTPIDSVILGASRPEQLEENIGTLQDGPLNEKAVHACDEIWSRLRGITPKYNR